MNIYSMWFNFLVVIFHLFSLNKVLKIILLAITLERPEISECGFQFLGLTFNLLSDDGVLIIPCDLNFRSKMKNTVTVTNYAP